MRVLIASDAWHPQVNGVVGTLLNLEKALARLGTEVHFLTAGPFRTLPMPGYREIRLAITTARRIGRRIEAIRPDCVHIATEGPLGILTRRFCLSRKIPFTTSYHTRFPEFIRSRLPVPASLSYAWLRRFHNAGCGMLVAAPSLCRELAERGFTNIRPWTRGVDIDLFNPERRVDLDVPRPVFLYVGRLAVEKNLPAFLDLDLPGSKVVVGDGPEAARLRARYPQVRFMGARFGEDLARIYASADVFVFPSKTDTFGNVLIEALASGCPAAAFPVTGPMDILGDAVGGVLSEDLRQAALAALEIPRTDARKKSLDYSWSECAEQFLRHVEPTGVWPDSRTEPSRTYNHVINSSC